MIKKQTYFKNLNLLLVTCFFFLFLIVLRMTWISFLDVPDGPTAAQGVLDLTDVDTSANFKMKLNGEWEFYPNALLASDNNYPDTVTNDKVYSQLPETWDSYFEQEEEIRYGTYRLEIVKDHEGPKLYGITIPESLSPYELYINGQLIGGIGKLATDDRNSAVTNRPVTYYFMLDSNENELLIQGAQMNPYVPGGISTTILFGDMHSMEQGKLFSNVVQVIVCLIVLLYFLFTILLYTIGIREKTLIYFSILSMTTAISILAVHYKPLFIVIPVNWIWANKILYLTFILAIYLFIIFLQSQIKEYEKSKILRTLSLFYLLYLVFLLLAPIEYIYRTFFIFNFLYLISPIIIAVLVLLIALKGQKGIIYLVITATAVAANSLTFTLNRNDDLPIYYPYDILIAITALSTYWFTRYFQTTLQTERLSIRLQKEIDQKDDFLANTSHELRNPLHGIINIAQTMLEKGDDKLDATNKGNLELLLTIGNHMSFMLNDLLDLVRVKEKTLRLQKKPINIWSVVTGVSDMSRFMLQGKPVELLVLIPKDLPFVMADENRLIQIFSNLLHNAIKFTDTGSITINAVVQGENLVISITDTGIGIKPSMVENIFDPYEQVDSSITSMSGGLGLGLSICQELVTLHGGTISLSTKVGEGSTFTFSLPIAQGDIEVDTSTNNDMIFSNYTMLSKFEGDIAATVPKESKLVTSRPRILVVDDDAVNLRVLVNVLSTEQYDIETALSGFDALEKLEDTNFDLLISDIMMPHMSGYELARRVRERYSIAELPILFLTARQQREDIHQAFLIGANDYVTKPMEYMELKARVKALIGVKQSIEERLRMEAAWLQAQIQPHFFFNTLNSIISLHGVDEEKLGELLFAFSDYLQMSFAFQNADLVVPIDYELKLVRSYIAIEQIRFDDRITVVWDIQEPLELSVPPLLIQTIVENAIQHGILKKIEGGTITIRITESEEQFTVFVIDNGVGFDQTIPPRKKSVGLANTEQRLKQLFGVELQVVSVLGKGTTVSFPIPKKQR
ncbi:MAG: ATP-binding protein [Lysinibacillus sp.]